MAAPNRQETQLPHHLGRRRYPQRDFTRFYCRNLTPLALTAAVCQRLRTVPLCSVSNEARTPLRIARFLLLYLSR